MSLIDTATLILTPNAGKTGKLYSVIPSNGNGDFTVTRATTATRTNSAGLIEVVPYNLLQYSEEFENAIWTKLNVSVTANTTTSPSGVQNADSLVENTATGLHLILQAFVSTATTYSYTCYIKPDTRTRAYLRTDTNVGTVRTLFDLTGAGSVVLLNHTSATITNIGNGWYKCSITFIEGVGAVGRLVAVEGAIGTNISYTGNGLTAFYLWGAQLVEGTTAKDYLRTETRLNIPRLDYSLGSCPNILLEPQRTNLALYSEEFDNSAWTKSSSTITPNSTISPSGIVNADTLTGDGTSNVHFMRQDITIVSGSSYTTSFYAKKGTNNFLQIYYGGGGFATNTSANFDLNNGVLGTVGAGGTATITSIGNGWYRCTITATSISTSASIIVNIITSATSARAESNTLSTSLFLWGAQVEAGAYATSYIPTTTASVTRNADIISRDNVYTNGLISASGGTWFVELSNNVAIQRDSATQGIFINTGTSSTIGNGITIRSLGGLVRNSIVKIISGIATTIYTTTSNTCKIAIKWNGTTADVFENGVKVVSATSFTPTAMQNLIGDGSALTLNINQMALWATPLTDDQLELLTGDSFNTYAEMASFYNYTLQ